MGPSCNWVSCSSNAKGLRGRASGLPQAKLSRKSNQVARGRIRRFKSYMPSHAVCSPLRGAPDMARTVERPRHPQVPSPRHHLLDRGTCTRLPGDRVRCHVLDDGSGDRRQLRFLCYATSVLHSNPICPATQSDCASAIEARHQAHFPDRGVGAEVAHAHHAAVVGAHNYIPTRPLRISRPSTSIGSSRAKSLSTLPVQLSTKLELAINLNRSNGYAQPRCLRSSAIFASAALLVRNVPPARRDGKPD